MGPLWNVILIEVIIWHLSTFLECLHCTCRTHSLVCVSVSLCVCTIHEHNLWVNIQLSDLYKSSNLHVLTSPASPASCRVSSDLIPYNLRHSCI